MAIANGETDVKLEFDFSWDHTNATNAWAQLGIFVNSSASPPFTNGFLQYGTGALIGGNMGETFPELHQFAINDGVTLTPLGPNSVHIAIPMGVAQVQSDDNGLHVMPGTFHDIGFKTNGGWGGTVDWAIDNIQLTGVLVPTTEETLFSWETPDNPSTNGVDERFEGWIPGNFANNPPHQHAITMTGATHGTHALEIDRTNHQSGFTWGSLFVLNSDTDPGPGEVIDPVIQARIEELIGKVEAADRVAFDLTYQYEDLFPLPDPTYTKFGVHFSDETGVFYQAFGNSINVVAAVNPATVTVEIPLIEFVDANNTMQTLKTTGLLNDSNFFRIGISSDTDGAQVYQIDNFRLVTEIPEGVPGDFNQDGKVDAADYVLWRKNGGSAEDYNLWRQHFGEMAMPGGGAGSGHSAVPEPAAGLVLSSAVMGGLLFRRRPISMARGT